MAFIEFSLECDPCDKDQVEMFDRISSGENVSIEIAGYKLSMKGSAKFANHSAGLMTIDGSLGDLLYVEPTK